MPTGGSIGGDLVTSAVGETLEATGITMIAVAGLPRSHLSNKEKTYISKYENPTNGKISDEEYDKLRVDSIHNKDAKEYMLGKYDPNHQNGYIEKAGKKYKYFDMGDNWNRLIKEYGFNDKEIFDSFNRPFIQEGIDRRAAFNFSHDPYNPTGSFSKEIDILIEAGYIPDPTNAFRWIKP